MAKKKYVAVHEVHFTEKPGVAADKQKGVSAKPPVTRIVKPKSSFMLDEEAAAPLLETGAIRVAPKVEEEEVVDASTETKGATKKKAPAKKAPAKETEEKNTSSEDSAGSEENLV